MTYPARIQLIAAMNPCRCGFLAEPGRACGRAPRCAQEYQSRLSGPLLDRIDLQRGACPSSVVDFHRLVSSHNNPVTELGYEIIEPGRPSDRCVGRPRRQVRRVTPAWAPAIRSQPVGRNALGLLERANAVFQGDG